MEHRDDSISCESWFNVPFRYLLRIPPAISQLWWWIFHIAAMLMPVSLWLAHDKLLSLLGNRRSEWLTSLRYLPSLLPFLKTTSGISYYYSSEHEMLDSQLEVFSNKSRKRQRNTVEKLLARQPLSAAHNTIQTYVPCHHFLPSFLNWSAFL